MTFRSVLLTTLLSLAFITSTASAQKNAVLNEQQIQQFCEEKPIWSGFGIPVKDCSDATRECAYQEKFAQLDPKILSEEFYNCVFKKLNFEID